MNDQAAPNGNVLLDVNNVSLAFGGVKALENVSFNVLEGEIRAIIGPNGAGKSSMLNVINGFYHPQDGEITYIDLADPADEHHLATLALAVRGLVDVGNFVLAQDDTGAGGSHPPCFHRKIDPGPEVCRVCIVLLRRSGRSGPA